MKLLITGGNGYIAKSLYNSFKEKYNITIITRHDFDLTNFQLMSNFFKENYFDVVIHCASQGGNRLKKDSYADMDVNLILYYNLLQHKHHYKKFIHFGSGVETDYTETPYSLSKKIISNSISEKENFYNIKIFGVFDENELETRFIKSNIIRYIKKEPMIIHQDKFMDFFYMEDLIYLVDYYINNDNLPKNIDCTYLNSFCLSDIVNKINNLSDYKCDISILKENYDKDYIGKFTNLGIKLIGIDDGIKIVYNKLKNI